MKCKNQPLGPAVAADYFWINFFQLQDSVMDLIEQLHEELHQVRNCICRFISISDGTPSVLVHWNSASRRRSHTNPPYRLYCSLCNWYIHYALNIFFSYL